jgi:DNA-binding IclR family transcriptional regulator
MAVNPKLPESTVHRFRANLEGSAFLNRSGDALYRPGNACFAIGQAALGQLEVRA